MKRRSVMEVLPKSMTGMYELEKYIRASALEPTLRELIKVRSSEINKCAYCMDMHTEEAMELGESPRRLFATAAWPESPLFTKEERIVLKITEEVTNICIEGVKDETFDAAVEAFGEEKTALIILQAVVINMWNRLAIAGHSIFKSKHDQ